MRLTDRTIILRCWKNILTNKGFTSTLANDSCFKLSVNFYTNIYQAVVTHPFTSSLSALIPLNRLQHHHQWALIIHKAVDPDVHPIGALITEFDIKLLGFILLVISPINLLLISHLRPRLFSHVIMQEVKTYFHSTRANVRRNCTFARL
jgi:hypothetical protein